MSYLRYLWLFAYIDIQLTHIIFCLSSSYVPYVANFSGLFICDCPFVIL
jgi:hypothetical protein